MGLLSSGAFAQHAILERQLSYLCIIQAINEVTKSQRFAYTFPKLRCTFGERLIIPDIAVLRWENIALDNYAMLNAKNLKTYQSQGIVQYYAQLQQLQPAEATILECLKDILPNMTMLDMGVGGGRTTQHFAKVVADYTGIDYSAEMVSACQQRFAGSLQPDSFVVCDARDMSCFPDDTFDFILFSFNGIDYIEHGDRIQALQEIQRVGKPGGYFCFSTHNLQGIEQTFNWRTHLSFNPLSTYIDLVMWVLLRVFNRSLTLPLLKTSAHAMIRDEPHNFRLWTYHIRPRDQIDQLASNFKDIKVYSWQTGLELSNSELKFVQEMWLYYLCVIP